MMASVALIFAATFHANQAEDTRDGVESVASLLEFVIEADEETARKCLATLAEKIQNGEVRGDRLERLRKRLEDSLKRILEGDPDGPLFFDTALLAACWRNRAALDTVRKIAREDSAPAERRLRALAALIAAADPETLDLAARFLTSQDQPPAFRAGVLAALGRWHDPQVAPIVLQAYGKLSEELRPKAIELLTQRTSWSKSLLEAIGRSEIPASALNVNQVGKLLASRDRELVEMVRSKWGSIRTERNPQREQIIDRMRDLLSRTPGNPQQGQLVFNKVCGQCHKIYGVGQEVGPDITRNGRSSFEQLLSNVFDPSLVIGAAYQPQTVITQEGRVLTGLVAEDNDQRIVLKAEGGKLETIAREQIDEVQVSKLSLMPEGLETQLTPQELADLFAFLTLDRPPSDPAAALILGTPAKLAGSGN